MQIPHKTPPSFDQRSAPVAPSAPSLKALTTLVSLAALALTASAATINVNSNASLASALSGANPGDTIVLANGSYAGFTVSRSGTASAPITVEAANQGGATISSGFIHLAQNSYVIIQGLTLTTPGATATIDGSSGSAAIWLEAARNCRVSRCTFKLAGASGTQWVTVAGASDSNRIDHCEFGPNSSTGTRYILARGNPTIPGVTPPSDRTSWANGNGPVNPNMSRNTRIDHNYFHDKSGTGETIGLGAIGVTGDYQNTNSLVEYNLFVNCDSDPEIITTKSSSNIIRYNTVRTCSGMFSLRAGNGSSIYGNFMLQGRKSGTGGIKIYEKNHTIFNNYIDSADQYPILIGAGDSYSGGHFSHAQVFDALIVHNTVVNLFDRPVIMGHGSTDHLPPTDVVFANNIIQGTAATLFTVSTAPSNPTYSDNIIYPNGPSGFSAGQFEVVNPQFTTVNGLQKLSSGSPAINAANQNYFSFVTDDMDGQTRNSHRDIGADEFSSAPIVRQPLTTGDVGPLSDLTPQAAAPAFSPGGGTYTGAQSVTITSATSGTSIRYTTDGSAPSETAGTLYSGPVPIASTTTLQAIAYGAGLTDSTITRATYTITLPSAGAPAFSPAAGTYSSAQSVTITSATSGASIRYTTDGSTPSETAGTVYSGPISISNTASPTTLKAIAYKAGFADSSVTSGIYTITTVPPPTFNFEAESLSPAGTGATVSISNDANASGGVVEFLNSTAAGQKMTFTTPAMPAGTYQVQLRYKSNTTRGIHSLTVDGIAVGTTLDQYATSQAYLTKTFGNVTLTTSGAHTIVMTVTGKNSAATQFYLTADKFTFVGQ